MYKQKRPEDPLKGLLMIALGLIVIAIVSGCTNPRPELEGGAFAPAGFCESYELKEIYKDDSLKVQLEKLEENTTYQRLCR